MEEVQTLSSVQLLVRSGIVVGYHKTIDAYSMIRQQLKWISGNKNNPRYTKSFEVIQEQLDTVIGLLTPRKRSMVREFGNSPEVLRRHQEIIVNAGILDLVWDILSSKRSTQNNAIFAGGRGLLVPVVAHL